MLSRVRRSSWQSQVRILTAWRISKIITMSTPRSRSPQASAHCIFYGFGFTKEDSRPRYWLEKTLYPQKEASQKHRWLQCMRDYQGQVDYHSNIHRENQAPGTRSADTGVCSVCWTSMASWSLAVPYTGHTQTPFILQAKTLSFLNGLELATYPMTHMLKQC